MKKLFLIISMIFCFASLAVAADLTIQSDKQIFKDQDNKIILDGNVKVKMDKAAIGTIVGLTDQGKK